MAEPLKVNIFGVGRSGTTALYVLVQAMMSRGSGNSVHFYYEPFLRDLRVLDGLYGEVADRMQYVDSLSPEGIYRHLQLPLFIENSGEFYPEPYLDKIFSPPDHVQNVLAKFIRLNGRYRLVNAVCPECRSIFLIRNPLDTVYSILRRFSYFGGEFHRDDYPRFIEEVNRVYGTAYSVAEKTSTLEKELLYWYYMNRFALESFARPALPPLVICYEDYAARRSHWIPEVCRFLGLGMSDEYIALSEAEVGAVTRDFEISEEEVDLFKEYFEKYIALLSGHRIPYHFTFADILSKYRIVPGPIDRDRPFYGLHARALQREYIRLLEEKEQALSAVRERLSFLKKRSSE